MLIVMTIVAAILGLWVQRNQKQKDTIAQLRLLGGEVHYTHQIEENSEGLPVPTGDADPPGPSWLRQQMGIDSFATVASVTLPGDDSFAPSHVLWKSSCTLVMPDLFRFSELQSLDLRAFDIREDDLPGFKELERLESLKLYLVPISVEGCRHIGKLKQLKELWIGKCEISHNGLDYFRNLTNLTQLAFYGERVSGTGLSCLEEMHKLKKLDLRLSDTTDEDLKYLADLVSLEELYLDETPISGPGVIHLIMLPNLRIISIEGCNIIYAKWIERMQQSNPNLLVMR